MSDRDELMARIIATQREMERLFAQDRSHPLFSLHLTLPQLKILLLLSHLDGAGGQELGRAMGVSLATVTGIVDRLVAQDLVVRREDPRDRRVRRVELSRAGHELVEKIVTAGTEGLQRVLSRLSVDDLRILDRAGRLVVQAAAAESATAGQSPAAGESATNAESATAGGTGAATEAVATTTEAVAATERAADTARSTADGAGSATRGSGCGAPDT